MRVKQVDKSIERLQRKNEMCNDFSKEWGEYFNNNFPWDKLNLTDAYLTIIVTVGNLFANYARDDIEGGLIALDTFMDSMKEHIAKVMLMDIESDETNSE